MYSQYPSIRQTVLFLAFLDMKKAVMAAEAYTQLFVWASNTSGEKREIINADRYWMAWFDPSPKAWQSLQEHLLFCGKDSPPVHAERLYRHDAECRNLP